MCKYSAKMSFSKQHNWHGKLKQRNCMHLVNGASECNVRLTYHNYFAFVFCVKEDSFQQWTCYITAHLPLQRLWFVDNVLWPPFKKKILISRTLKSVRHLSIHQSHRKTDWRCRWWTIYSDGARPFQCVCVCVCVRVRARSQACVRSCLQRDQILNLAHF